VRSGSETGSYLRLIDFVHHSTLGSRVIKKKNLEELASPFLQVDPSIHKKYVDIYIHK